jgi:hypothetical protein
MKILGHRVERSTVARVPPLDFQVDALAVALAQVVRLDGDHRPPGWSMCQTLTG